MSKSHAEQPVAAVTANILAKSSLQVVDVILIHDGTVHDGLSSTSRAAVTGTDGMPNCSPT